MAKAGPLGPDYLLLPAAALADTVKTYFDPLDQAQKRTREGLGVQVDLIWAEAFHFPALEAIEV
jgi:hypothetical protein